MTRRSRAVFLDRDGVLNRAIVRDGRPFPPSTLEALEVLPGVAEAVQRLCDAGFLLIGATNQPDVARGTQRREVVEAMNARLVAEMPITAILVCYEDGDDSAGKPNPGLLLEAAETYGIDLAASFMIGGRGPTSKPAAEPAAAPSSSIWITPSESPIPPPITPPQTCRPPRPGSFLERTDSGIRNIRYKAGGWRSRTRDPGRRVGETHQSAYDPGLRSADRSPTNEHSDSADQAAAQQ